MSKTIIGKKFSDLLLHLFVHYLTHYLTETEWILEATNSLLANF